METPSDTTSSWRLLGLGEFHIAALGETPDTTGSLVEVFRPNHDQLDVAHQARLAAERAMIAPRVALRFSERRLEQKIRQLSNAAESLDDGKGGGPIWSALFPNKLDPEIRPRSAAQKAAAEKLLNERLNTLSRAEPLRAVHGPALADGIRDLGEKLAARERAANALGLAGAREDAARDDFIRAYDSNAGAIRQLFPKDRDQQDLYFDEVRRRRRRTRSGGEDVVTGDDAE